MTQRRALAAPDAFRAPRRWSRREAVTGLAALTGSMGLWGWDAKTALAEPPPETSKIRFAHAPAICLAPQYLAESLLAAEGFSSVEYVELKPTTGIASAPAEIAAGRADMSSWDTPSLLTAIDVGLPITLISGIHAGCYQLLGHEDVHAVRDLKGRKIATSALGNSDHVYLSSILAYVGIDPRKDVQWLTGPALGDAPRIFADRKADAFLGFAPQPQELRAKKVGHVILDTAQDRPWSQYFCCMLAANRDFVTKYPVATKRALRAILKGADLCAQEPERVARYLAAKGFETRYEIGLDVLKSLPYQRWREANPEDTLRFHSLRLHEVGMIKSTPQKIIAQGTDWRFLNELKKELKA